MVILRMLRMSSRNVQQVGKAVCRRGEGMARNKAYMLQTKLTLGVKGIQLQRLMTQPWQ